MEIKRTEAAIEAILFAMGESVELSRIATAVGQDKDTTRRLLHHMMDRYQEEDRGIQIIELEQSYQMCTKKEYYENLIQIALHPQKPVLTDVMLETLSIIAYKQPVTYEIHIPNYQPIPQVKKQHPKKVPDVLPNFPALHKIQVKSQASKEI